MILEFILSPSSINNWLVVLTCIGLFVPLVIAGCIFCGLHESAKSYPAFLISFLLCSCSMLSSWLFWAIGVLKTPILPHPITPPDIWIIGCLLGILLYGATVIYNKKHWGQCYPWYYITEKRK